MTKSEFAGDQQGCKDSRRGSYHAMHVDLRDEDVIEGIAYDVEPDSRW